MSQGFGAIDFEGLTFPAHMLVDWIRVYQPKGQENIGCDPPNYPTEDYITLYPEAYSNANLTTWEVGAKSRSSHGHVLTSSIAAQQFGQPKPQNKLVDNCS